MSPKYNNSAFFSNIRWLLGGKIIQMILRFVVSLATARYLGPSNLGTINYVAAYTSFFTSVTSLGLSIIVIKEIATNNHDSNEIVWTSIILRLTTSILSSICLVSLMYITNKDDTTIIIIAVLESISILFSSFETASHYFQAKLQAKWGSIAGVLAYIGMSVFRIILLAESANVIWFALATSSDMILLSIFLMVFYIKKEGLHITFNFALGVKLLKQSYHYLIAGLITILYTQIDRIMLGHMLDKAYVGYYSVALTISQLWSMVPSAFIQTISPILYSTAKEDRSLFIRRLSQSYSVIFWANALYSIIITIFANPIIKLLYGPNYLTSTNALRIVVWYYGLSTMTSLTQAYLVIEKKSKYISKYCLSGLVMNIILNTLFIPLLGINGAALATLVTHIITQFITPYMYKETREVTLCLIRGITFRGIISKEEVALVKHQLSQKFIKN